VGGCCEHNVQAAFVSTAPHKGGETTSVWAINKDAGIVQRVLRLLDELAKADANGVLKDVRAAAAGESGAS